MHPNHLPAVTLFPSPRGNTITVREEGRELGVIVVWPSGRGRKFHSGYSAPEAGHRWAFGAQTDIEDAVADIVRWASGDRWPQPHKVSTEAFEHARKTLWLSNGLDLKTVQTWLGHKSATLTADTYAHWMGAGADAAAIARMNLALSGDAGGTRTANLRTAD